MPAPSLMPKIKGLSGDLHSARHAGASNLTPSCRTFTVEGIAGQTQTLGIPSNRLSQSAGRSLLNGRSRCIQRRPRLPQLCSRE